MKRKPDLGSVALAVVLLVATAVAARLLLALLHQGGVVATRAMAVAFMLCDIAIASSLVLLLVARENRPPAWLERRLPYRGRWVWYALVSLVVLCYLGLAPTFLYFLIHVKK